PDRAAAAPDPAPAARSRRHRHLAHDPASRLLWGAERGNRQPDRDAANMAVSRSRRSGKAGLEVLARVKPKSARDGIDGLVETAQGQAFKVRVRAVAEDGAANRAVEVVVAKWLGLAASRVKVLRGGKSRVKLLGIAGEPAEVEALVAARIAALG